MNLAIAIVVFIVGILLVFPASMLVGETLGNTAQFLFIFVAAIWCWYLGLFAYKIATGDRWSYD